LSIDPRFLQRVDLNLLKVFKAVHDLRQTTAAAERLGVSQPAVSQSLKRLRDLVGDPLFVPAHAGVEPTARANELAGPVGEALAAIQRALERPPQFDPATARRRFRIGMLDYGVMVLAPAIAGAISRQAPGVSVEISHVPSDAAARLLLSDEIDLATGPFVRPPAALDCEPLFEDAYVVVARRDHPALAGGLDVETLTRLSYVDIAYDASEGGGMAAALARRGIDIRKAMQAPMFAGACFIAGSSDLAAIVPERLAHAYRDVCSIAVHRPPVALPPLRISALTHRRNSSDAGLRWLRDILVQAGAESAALGP